jgi:dipeptidyl aminopeptidase/acylaminoacyl peptidase
MILSWLARFIFIGTALVCQSCAVHGPPNVQPTTSTASLVPSDGTVVERREFALSDEQLTESVKSMPDRESVERRLREQFAKVKTEEITYLSDGLRIKGLVASPREPGRYPCLVACRGGNRDFGAWPETRAAIVLGRMAARGYLVVASNYRGSPGSEGADEFGGRDVNDILNLLPLLEAEPQADTGRIGIWGISRGGMMIYQVLRRTDRFKAACVVAGIADLRAWVIERPDIETGVYAQCIPDYTRRRDEALRERSAVLWVDELPTTTPILIMQGTADWRLSPMHSLNMAAALLSAKHPFRLVMFEGADHSLTEVRESAQRESNEWFDRFVRDGAPLPNLEPHGL